MTKVHNYLTDDGILVFKLTGEMKIATSEDAKIEIKSIIEEKQPERAMLDLSELTLLDSAGLSAFISVYKQLAVMGGKLGVCDLRGQPKAIFEISNLQKIIPVFPTLEEGIKGIT